MKAFTNHVGRTARSILAWRPSSTGLALSALCAITLAFYLRLWLPDLVLIRRDAFRYFLPLKQYVMERLLAGELPQWFPYSAMGYPFIGTSGIGLFHPFTALYFLLPVHEAYRFSTLVACLMAACGAFVLGRMLGYSRAGAVLAGIALALSGYVVSLTDNLLYLYAICVLPLFCASLEKALAEQRAWVVAPAVLWATVFLHGDVQTGYYYGFVALLWVGMRAPGAYREAWLRFVLTAGLAALLAGIQLGPSWAVFAGSNRVQSGAFHEMALHWSTHPLRLLTVIASPVGREAKGVEVAHLFFGGQVGSGMPAGLWAESLYLGLPVIGLALMGAWYRRDLRVLVWLTGLAFLLALGRAGGLYEVAYQVVPFWSAFRYPEKLMGLTSFGAAMLAGAGLDALRRGQGRSAPWFVAAFLCAGVGAALRAEAVTTWVAANFGATETLTREITRSASDAILFSVAAGIVVGLVAVGLTRTRLRADFLLVFLVAIIALDLFRANEGAYDTAPVEAATFTPGLVGAIKRHADWQGPGHFRIYTYPEDVHVSREPIGQWIGRRGVDALMMRQALDLEFNAQFGIESIRVYLSLVGEEVAAFLSAWPKSGLQTTARYNVAYYIGRSIKFSGPALEKNLVAYVKDYDLALIKNPLPVKPRAYLSLRPELATSPVKLSALAQRADFLSGEVDVIEAPEGTLPGPAKAGQVSIERYAPEEVRILVETPERAVLVLLDIYAAGWRATLDSGEELPILRANGLVRAVVVPAGTHVVTFAYETPLLKAGAVCSLIGVIGCLGMVGRERWRKDRASQLR